MLELIPISAHGHERDQHRDRNRQDGNDGAGDVPQEDQDHEGHHGQLFDQRVLQVVDGCEDQVGAVVGGHDLDARGQAGFDLFQLGLDALDDPQRVLALPHDDDAGDHFALAVEIGDAAAHVGAERHGADVAHQDGHARRAGPERDVRQIAGGVGIAAAAHHVFAAGEFHQPPAHVVVAAAHRRDHFRDRNAVGRQAVGIDVDLILPHEAAERRHFRDARHGLQLVAQKPVLVGAQLGQVVAVALIHQRVLEDPADAGGIRTELGLHALRQARQDLRKVLQGARARPVDVGAFLEDDVDVGVAEIGEAAHVLHLGRAQHGGDDRIGDLVLDDVGAAVPARVDDHLGVAEIRDGVERDGLHRPPARHGGRRHEQEHEEAVVRRELDDAVDHFEPGFPNPSGNCRR